MEFKYKITTPPSVELGDISRVQGRFHVLEKAVKEIIDENISTAQVN